MNKNDANELMMEYQNNRSNELRSKIINENMPLVYYIIKKNNYKFDTFEDMSSIGCIGLIRAVDTYNVSLNTPFSIYASRCINNSILSYYRVYKSRKDVNIVLKNAEDENDNRYAKIDKNTDVEEEVLSRLENEYLLKMMNKCLKEKNLEILKRYYGLCGYEQNSYEEIGKTYGFTRQAIQQSIKRSLEKIKRNIMLLDEDNDLFTYSIKKCK